MASQFPSPVGSYFVAQYYQVLQQQPELVHQFYNEASTMVRVDGDSSESATSILQIHRLITSLQFVGIEIKTINTLESWNGGLLVMVSGVIRMKDYVGKRKFVQSFFLAPQEKGYFVLNDIFQFIHEERIPHHPAPESSENKLDSHLNASIPLPETPGVMLRFASNVKNISFGSQFKIIFPLCVTITVSDYVLVEEARDYVNSVHVEEDDPVDKYSLPEQPQEHEEYLEPETVVEEAPIEEPPHVLQSGAQTVHEPLHVPVEEPAEEPVKKTYAFILRAKGQSMPSGGAQPAYNKSIPPTTEWHQTAQPSVQQLNSGPLFVSESVVDVAEDNSGLLEEVESKSVYVRNLPVTVTVAEIEREFQNYGIIKPDGVFLRSRKDIGVCYAFVEFEDILGVQNALQASPIQLAGKQVYIEERRPNSTSAFRGRGRGRGRGTYPTTAPRGGFSARNYGRGSNQDGNDYNRARGNGFHVRGSR
ncbi:Nuclear transport factor 2 domain [Dillenia turbinata]|uniref:Nuclear transport factor 2 domain n=1 Tax=Dillenia turbinata TaxID=194707 RepID=A0AAN8VT43_9MAGN